MKQCGCKKALFVVAILAAVLIFGPQREGQAATLEVLPSGEGVFTIQGTGIENTGAMDFTVVYDTSSLANPRVVQGGLISGALMVVNDKVPGAVRLAIIRTSPIQGSGAIATLTFDRKGNSAGKIVSLTVNKFVDVNGQSIPVAARISNPAGTPAGTSGPSQVQEETQSASGGTVSGGGAAAPVQPGVIVAPGIIVSPGEKGDQSAAAAQSETLPERDTTTAAKEQGASKGITASLEPQKKRIQQFMSVLERFRMNDKERTAKAFLFFFDQVEANGFRQEPAVALSDGKMTVKIFFVVSAGSSAPDFALRGARLISLNKDAERSNAWVIEAKPEKGEYEASLTVSQGDVMLEYPLVLAPKIDLKIGAKPVTDELLRRYLVGKRRDLNGDGRRDYLDDYIFTANFIAARQKK